MQQYADIYLLQNHSICFECLAQSSSNAGGRLSPGYVNTSRLTFHFQFQLFLTTDLYH